MNENSWAEEVKTRYEAAAQNSCRDLIEVEGGSEWRIRKLIDRYPDSCWKYASSSTILKYPLEKLEDETIVGADLPQSHSDFRILHVRIIDSYSPFDFSVQPKYLDRARASMTNSLNEEYSRNSESWSLSEEQLFPDIACAVFFKGEWFRGRIKKVQSIENIYVRLIDLGSIRVVGKSHVKRLKLRFGRIPPMVLRCRVRGVLVQEMDAYKVEAFRREMEALDNLVRCQVTNDEEPYLVNLFHPTIYDLNVCEHFYAKKSMNLPEKQLEAPELDSEDSDFDDEEEELSQQHLYIRHYPRSLKAMRIFDNDFTVLYVEHANLIFLENASMTEQRKKIDERLQECWPALPSLPEAWLEVGTACAVLVQEKPRRGSIEYVGQGFLEIVTIDYGQHFKVKNADIVHRTRAVVDDTELSSIPQLIVVSLDSIFRIHLSAIRMLRKIIPIGSSVQFEPNRKSKQIPIRGNISLLSCSEEPVDLETVLLCELESSKIDINCLCLIPYSSQFSQNVSCANSDFVYRKKCARAFSHSLLEVSPLPLANPS